MQARIRDTFSRTQTRKHLGEWGFISRRKRMRFNDGIYYSWYRARYRNILWCDTSQFFR